MAPMCDSKDSEDGDEERLEMGLTATVMQYTERECKELSAGTCPGPAPSRGGRQRGAFPTANAFPTEDVGGVGALEKQHAIKGVRLRRDARDVWGHAWT